MNQKPEVKKLAPIVVGGLFALFLLFYLRPYYGIRHDAILYLGQALLRSDPANFGKDLFFAYGSQASFTIFPDLLAILLKYVNAAQAFFGLTIFGLLFFLAASTALLFRLFPSPLWYWGLLAVLAFPGLYGGRAVFSYAEPFFSGRSLAEPLVLIAIAAYLTGWKATAGIVWLFGALLHPLQALPALMVWWCDRVRTNLRWLHLLWVPACGLLAGALGVAPFDRLLTPYDSQWLSWSHAQSPHVFFALWTLPDWAFFTSDLFLVWVVTQRASGPLKQLARAVLGATLLGFTLNLVLADGLSLILPTGLQLWRVHWLLHWLAMASIPFLLHGHYRSEGWRGLRGWFLLTMAILGARTLMVGPSALTVWVLMPLYVFWPRLEPHIRPGVRNTVLLALPLALAAILFKQSVLAATLFDINGGLRELIRPEFALLSHPVASGGLAAMALAVHHFKKRWRGALLVLLIPMLAHAAAQWDRRSTQTRFIEAAQNDPLRFGVEMPEGAQVYWDKELVAAWLILHRPSYFSSQQFSGVLFNRKTAEVGAKRFQVVQLLEFQLEACRLMNNLNKDESSCSIDEELIAEVCEKSEGTLDYLVLDNRIGTGSAGSWTIKVGGRGDQTATFHLYPCKNFLPDNGKR